MKRRSIDEILSRGWIEDDSGRRPLNHVASRHMVVNSKITQENGEPFGQGDRFPRHVKSKDISRIRAYIVDQYWQHRKSLQNSVIACEERNESVRVRCKISRYGIKIVEALFNKVGDIITFYPIEANGQTHIVYRDGSNTRKAHKNRRRISENR